ncbi:hypothetical protein D3C72_1286770 [compost metagenome]
MRVQIRDEVHIEHLLEALHGQVTLTGTEATRGCFNRRNDRVVFNVTQTHLCFSYTVWVISSKVLCQERQQFIELVIQHIELIVEAQLNLLIEASRDR